MKLSEQQTLVLWDLLRMATQCIGGFAGYDPDFLRKMQLDILLQQSEEAKEVGTEEKDGTS